MPSIAANVAITYPRTSEPATTLASAPSRPPRRAPVPAISAQTHTPNGQTDSPLPSPIALPTAGVAAAPTPPEPRPRSIQRTPTQRTSTYAHEPRMSDIMREMHGAGSGTPEQEIPEQWPERLERKAKLWWAQRQHKKEQASHNKPPQEPASQKSVAAIDTQGPLPHKAPLSRIYRSLVKAFRKPKGPALP